MIKRPEETLDQKLIDKLTPDDSTPPRADD
jgi:hypothetical protein